MTTKRLFFALNATDPLSKSFLPIYKKIKINADKKEISVKWVPTENFHITVSFLGDRDIEDIPRITEVLKRVCTEFSPFDLKVEDVGAFSNEHDARVLWLGIQNKRALNEFKNKLDLELQAEGLFGGEMRDYRPHLTFGRLRNPRSVKDMISPFKRKSFGKIQVSEIVLYESTLQGAFPVYTPLLRCPLTGPTQEIELMPEL
ncbi:RNA 2',3'-cyclic phosphodiesterase [Bdellovibrio sp. HCB2-146]|uniref:RNA 2',3'-cyclic phosphodiesterase n=1 Tax=Bdellovibrio sp. HCB2-146 TaxID=3394362 RepID=UPI0039BC75F2